MKNTLLLAFIFLYIASSIGQNCPIDNVVLSNQLQVNKFGEDYPNCISLPANLVIAGIDIVDLSPLSKIESIGGSLVLFNCNRLKSLYQLNITEIKDSLTIEVNDSLTTISNLANVNGLSYINIDTNDALEEVVGFNTLDSLSDLIFWRNKSLTNIDGFNNVLEISNYLRYQSNTSLSSVPSFNNLRKLSNFYCQGNGPLKSIIGFEKLTHLLHADITLDSLSTILGFNNVIGAGSFYIKAKNPGFININIFNKVEKAGEIGLGGVDQLENVDAFNEIKHASQVSLGNIKSTLNGFSKLESLGQQGLSVSRSNFIDLNFLSSLKSISGFNPRIQLWFNPFLTDISRLDVLDPDSVNFVKVYGNPNLSICHSDLICSILERGDIDPVLGITEIYNNAEGCNSTEEILEQCADKPTEPTDPSLCPINSRPGMQIDRVEDDRYNIMYHYGSKRMYLTDVAYTELVDLIAYHKVEKDLLFDFATFTLERYCERAEDISRGTLYTPVLPDDVFVQYQREAVMSEIDFFHNFVLTISTGECVKI